MAIFSRRVVQRMITENARFLSVEQSEKFRQKLNKADETSIHFEWEVAMLNAFSKIGRIEHEKPLGTKRPDIFLSSYSEPDQTLIADITTVSDSGLGPEALVEAFEKRLRTELGKRKLKYEHFSYEIKRIPEKSIVTDFLDADLELFLDQVSSNFRAQANYTAPSGIIMMKYNPHQTSYQRSVPITSAKSLTKNTFHTSLKSKLKDLKAANFTGPRAIILCDGGSNLFYFRQTDVLKYGSDDIIKDFLRRNGSINFVMTAWVERTPDPARSFKLYEVKTQLFPNRSFDAVPQDIRKGLSNIEGLLPRATAPVESILSHIRQGYGRQSFSFHYWKPIVEKKQIKISARGLLSLLAGHISQDEFFEDQKFKSKNGSAMVLNPFMKHFRAGELISDISLEPSELDDDYIVITFDGADAAVSAYSMDDKDIT